MAVTPLHPAPRPVRRAARSDHLRTALPVTLALLLLASVAGAALWALRGALAFGVWFLGAG
jgi:hypothetical protein